MNQLRMSFAAAAAVLAMSRGVPLATAEAFLHTLPDGSALHPSRKGAFKRGQRAERGRSKARQNRRLHPRAQTR